MDTFDQARKRLCLALDVTSAREAEEIVAELKHCIGVFKIGMELFTNEGPTIVRSIVKAGGEVFLDLKYLDIPNTVAGAARAATRLGVTLFDLHASGGSTMMELAREAVQEEAHKIGGPPPRILAVTVLTSLTETDLQQELNVRTTLTKQVLDLALLAKKSGMDGVVASPHEIKTVRDACGESFIILTPGIRPRGAATQDQARVTTPREAFDLGANYIVIGRPILKAQNRVKACEDILAEMVSA
jgi:orotidine-5'-phosphate decarboxylase